MDSWGIDDAVFWTCLGGAFALAVLAYLWAAIRSTWPRAPLEPKLDPDDALYELAFLNGGAHLTITAVALKLHKGFDAEGATVLERSLLNGLRRAGPGASSGARRQLAGSDELARLDERLMARGLLCAPGVASLERWSVTACFALIAVSLVRSTAASDLGLATELMLDAMFICSAVGLLLVGKAHRLTLSGRMLLETRRRGGAALRTPTAGADLPMAVALFGGGVLWHADPAFAAAWEVPREDGTSGVVARRGGCGGGSCSDGSVSCSCG